jgi:hypothetical protein
MNITIAPLPMTFLVTARAASLDALKQPVRRVVAEGGEPCRDVLRRAQPGEELILASFSPFSLEGPYREFGPVFLLANASAESVKRDELPLDGYFRERFVLRAYSKDEAILAAELVTPDDAQQTLHRFLDRDDVAFVHARFPTYGCFACRIDRA